MGFSELVFESWGKLHFGAAWSNLSRVAQSLFGRLGADLLTHQGIGPGIGNIYLIIFILIPIIY